MANLTDADKVLRNDTGKDIVTQLTAIKTAIENGGGGGGGASTVSQLTDVLLSSEIPDGDVLVRDNNLTGGKLWKNVTITVELTQAEYNQLVADDEVLPDVNYYITDAPSMSGTSADLSYDGTTKSTYTKIEEIDTELNDKADTSTTYTKSEVDNIVDARKCSTYSIITLDTLTSTEQTFNTYGGRKFSDYDLYIFAFGSSDKNFRRTVVLTKSQWQSGANIDEGVLHGASTSTASSYDYCGIVVNYNNDTSIKAKVFGSGSINKFSVIGIKY